MACWRATGQTEQFGVSMTRDGGESFERFLIGEKVYDFAFDQGKVYVAGDNGLFISSDQGLTWRSINYFDDPSQPDRIVRSGISVFSVAAENGLVWIGTEDGLLKSSDDGLSWSLFRTEVPLHPETASDEVPDVDTYAYPNPFSPRKDQFTRIRYELTSDSNVNIKIFDFGMNPIRNLVDESRGSGVREDVWDGLDDRGILVANGAYLYSVDTGSETVWGKILLIE